MFDTKLKQHGITFDNTYARLPGNFHAKLHPTAVSAPRLIKANAELGDDLGIDPDFLDSPAALAVFAGNRVPEGSEPVAMAYAGHQFGGWVPQLGDGRAILLGEVVNRDGVRYDLHLKGAGRTPYSRNGDGRAWLGPVLREYVVSEAMAKLGIPTTRALSAVSTGETVHREEPFPGAVLTRVARGHIRVGTFEYFAARNDLSSLRILTDYCIQRFYPDCHNAKNPYLAFFETVLDHQAALIAKWMGVGFIHGVMNTDNMSISGETIDYGPCAFMDTYHPKTVFSSIDYMGRYAYENQPPIAKWNLSRLAACLIPLIHSDEKQAVESAQTALDTFEDIYEKAWTAVFSPKLGLQTSHPGDVRLIRNLLHIMKNTKVDFTNTFRALSAELEDATPSGVFSVSPHLRASPEWPEWRENWLTRVRDEGRSMLNVCKVMNGSNPAYIPRNHRIESMIDAAVQGDYSIFEKLLNVLSRPFEERQDAKGYHLPPKPNEVVQQTFCGT